MVQVTNNRDETEYIYNEGHLEEEPGKDAPVLMLGYTTSRRFLYVPIEPTGTYGVWRAVTAYEPDGPFYLRLYRKLREE